MITTLTHHKEPDQMSRLKPAIAAALLGLGIALIAPAPLLADETAVADSAEQTEKAKPKTELEKLQEEKALLAARYDLLLQQQRNESIQMELEKQRLAAENALRQARQAEEVAAAKAELERLQAEAQLRQAQQESQLSDLKSQVARLQAQKSLADTERDNALADIRAEAARLAAENQLKAARLEASNIELQLVQSSAQAEVTSLKKTLELRSTRDEMTDVVVNDINYLENPLQGDTLYVSDRRIPLNGPIISGTADWVTERIHYYNNLDNDLPIFIVIDNCPGGSVMQGYRIVKAIKESPAPVHVVVKSFAASMAAVITTLADHSYAYPNAIILHHQMSSGLYGNMTQMAEQLENAREWERRLAEPVAQKMGVSVERFREMMYENNSNGDWEEFAEQARDLHWVDTVVQEIREDGIRKRPTSSAPRPWYFIFFGEDSHDSRLAAMNAVQHDEKGRPFMQLPPLGPFDHYFLYDPQDFFRN